MKLSTNKFEHTGWMIIGPILFRLLLELSYVMFIVPIFNYQGYKFNPDLLKYIESWCLYILLLILFPKKLERPSNFFFAILLFVQLAPLLVFYGYSGESRATVYTLMLGSVSIYIFSRGLRIRLPFIKGGKYSIVILWAGVIGVTFGFIKLGGFELLNFNFLKVYEFRQASSETFGYGAFGYLSNWGPKIFGPMLISIALSKKKYFTVAIIAGLHVLWFGMSSHKGVVFYPIVVIGVWYIFRSSKTTAIVPIFLSLMIGVSMILFFAFENIVFGSLLLRRVHFVPSLLTFSYYDFFSQNQFVYWSNSLLSSFLHYPYSENPADLIGKYMGSNSYANNGLLASGYMHAGILGVVFYGALTGIMFRLIDALTSMKTPVWMVSAIFSVSVFTLFVSADLPTTLLTHGLGIAFILIFLYRRGKIRPHSS